MSLDSLSGPSSSESDFAHDPFRLLRLVVGGLLFVGTIVALVLAISGITPRAILLVGAFWAIYGMVLAFVGGVLEPVTDFLVMALQNVGLVRAGGGYSGIESMVVRGHYEAAAQAYLEKAHEGRTPDAEALVRRSALLAGPLNTPAAAVAELENLQNGRKLKPVDDLRVGMALADLYEHRLADPGRAMGELRRLIDRYPTSRSMGRVRRSLGVLREERFKSEG